ncbi:MAG: hypothetical protein HEP71_05260 [Roseivirga sp.]|nr:hypothetical protein [Roseivirga sp.]
MYTFQTYDQFRLSCFQNRKPGIRFGDTDSLTFYQFSEVDYFNYILFKSANYRQAELEEVLHLYLAEGRSDIKLLFPAVIKDSFTNLVLEETFHEIACLKQTIKRDLQISKNELVLTEVKTGKDLLEYTRIYLEGFGSDNTDYKEVSSNFELLWQEDSVDFFFVNHEGNRAGICSNYYGPECVFLSAGAILPAYRNMGLHKQVIADRIRLARLKGHTEFVSWAYTGSISYQNLVKSNFSHYASYCEYVSKPLEVLTKAGSLLQQ